MCIATHYMRRNILAWVHELLIIDLYISKLLVILLLLHELLDLLLLHHLLHLHLLYILLLLLRVKVSICIHIVLLDSVHHISVLVWISFYSLVLWHDPWHLLIHCNVEATVILIWTCNLSVFTIISSISWISVIKLPRWLWLFIFRLNACAFDSICLRWFWWE